MFKTNSKLVKKGDTFVALRGVNNDGHNYIKEAIKNGTTKVVVEEGTYSVETIKVDNTHDYLVNELDKMYGNDIKKLKLIGVTGTNGKTTTCFLCHEYLNKHGKKCGYIGTIGFYINDFIRPLSNTTPDVLEIYNMLLECIKENCEYVVMEVSSHSLSYNRLGNLMFDYVVFTNLTEEHLDYHKTMENYALDKQKLFYKLKNNGFALINNDDEYSKYFILEHNNNITYGKGNCDYKINSIKMNSKETSFYLNDNLYKMNLLGEYNVYNMSVVIILMSKIFNDFIDVSTLTAPVGRLETIYDKGRIIMIDYAHTPDAVEKVLNNVKNIASGRIITIIGCGGDRDKYKRPIMGKIASDISDVCIFTSDNPRNENPMNIINDMLEGITKKNVKVEESRREALNMGLHICKKNDILLVLGKGHENYQIIGNKKYPFNDKKIIEELIGR